MSEQGTRRHLGWLQLGVAFAAGFVVAAASIVEVAPHVHGDSVATAAPGATTADGAPGDGAAGDAAAGGVAGAAAAAGGADSGGGAARSGAAAAAATARSGLQCAAGKNGGSTDVGVSAREIALATTEVQSGIGASFLGEVKYAMEAERKKVNDAGGICGRRLTIQYVDDGWSAHDGAIDLQNFFKSNVFAIAVGPSSEGLRVEIDNKDVDNHGIPVVGTDGMLIDQYQDPWVWPVAASTASSARIMAADAARRGATSFSIVYDKNYRFGVEAADAYDAEVKRLTGHDVDGYDSGHTGCSKAFCGVSAGQTSYGNEVKELAGHAGDFLVMFLEPATALTWMSTPDAPTASKLKYGVSLGQPLFTRDFAVNCQAACDQMQVWTGYKPDIEAYANEPAVQQYVTDLHGTKPDADEFNAFSEGGYIGMQLLVKGLQAVGPDLTRQRLRAALDAIDLDGALTLQSKLSYRPGNHFANLTMQAFSIQFKGTFGGWRAAAVVPDPHPRG
jgi:ABC-type branched-subunit amino acid transport system substrate-binding protein